MKSVMSGDGEGEAANVTVWVKERSCYVRPMDSILWRVRNVARMAQTLRGAPEGPGALFEFACDDALRRFPPGVIEVCGPNSPLAALVQRFRTLSRDTLDAFFSRLHLLYVTGNDVPISEVLQLLSSIPLLTAFSYSDLCIEAVDYEALMKALVPLQLRAIDICDGDVDFLLRNMNVEIVRFCNYPGVQADSVARSTVESVTVRFLVAQALKYVSVNDAEQFLTGFVKRFPRLEALFWDWNMVDPEIVFDERAMKIADTLVQIFSDLHLQMFAVLAYAPSAETFTASEQLTRHLSKSGLPRCSLKRFATKGLTNGTNFVLLSAGENAEMVNRLEAVVCNEQNPSPDLRHFLHIWDASLNTHAPNATFEFYGFDSKAIQKEFKTKFAS